jgi:hypothetical protein
MNHWRRNISIHKCKVEGCGELTINPDYCNDCAGEIEALREMAVLQDQRREQRRTRRAERKAAWWGFWTFSRRIRERLWILNLVFVLGVIAYLGFVYGAEFIEWLQLGGWQ